MLLGNMEEAPEFIIDDKQDRGFVNWFRALDQVRFPQRNKSSWEPCSGTFSQQIFNCTDSVTGAKRSSLF